ncbi:MAG: hypothetical protein JXQ23_05020 [Clostridia bacterium]|nr:hypothetical protein [Clostridia bacterium]
MRDKKFVAIHRGGLLTAEQHIQLMRWARECSLHSIPLMNGPIDSRLVYALETAKDWENKKVKTGIAMKASVNAHQAARECKDSVTQAVSRSIGHAVATAHMADHALGAALYALKAVNQAGLSVEAEKLWQIEQLEHMDKNLAELVKTTLATKSKSFKL